MQDKGLGTWPDARRAAAAVLALAAMLLLAACAHQDPPGGSQAGRCCGGDAERQPDWLVAVAEPLAPALGRIVGHIAWRRGYLSDPAAQAEILSELQPLDVVFVSSKGRLSGHTIPGLFQHAAVYVGSEADLRALGMWSHPAVVPHREAIRRGAVFIEADMRGVHLSPASVVLNTDRMAATRPRIGTPRWKQRAVATLFGDLGRPFDFSFDATRPERLFCAELVCRAMPELRLPRDTVYGRETIIPDRIAYESALGRSRLAFRRYVAADADGRREGSRGTLAADIRRAWPD